MKTYIFLFAAWMVMSAVAGSLYWNNATLIAGLTHANETNARLLSDLKQANDTNDKMLDLNDECRAMLKKKLAGEPEEPTR